VDDAHEERRTIGEAFRLIADTRDQCAQRAATHVDQNLYASERDTLRRDLQHLSEAQAVLKQRHDDDTAHLRKQHNDHLAEEREWRRKMWLAVITAFIGPLLTGVFLFILLEVG